MLCVLQIIRKSIFIPKLPQSTVSVLLDKEVLS